MYTNICDVLAGDRRKDSVSDRMQSSRIITSINVEGELKGSHYGERASFDPRPELPAFETAFVFPLCQSCLSIKSKNDGTFRRYSYGANRAAIYVSSPTTERSRNIRQT